MNKDQLAKHKHLSACRDRRGKGASTPFTEQDAQKAFDRIRIKLLGPSFIFWYNKSCRARNRKDNLLPDPYKGDTEYDIDPITDE